MALSPAQTRNSAEHIQDHVRHAMTAIAEPQANVPPLRPIVSRVVETGMKSFIRTACRLRVSSEAPLPKTPFFVCSNHRSHADSAVLMTALGFSFQRCALLAAQDYFFIGSRTNAVVASIFRIVPFERQLSMAGFRRSAALCKDFLDAEGRAIIGYPEGTRGSTDQLREFKRGPTTLALMLGIPILPAYVHGTGNVMPKGRKFFVPAAVSVHFGTPIHPDSFAPDAPTTLRSREMTVALYSAIYKLGEFGKRGIEPAGMPVFSEG